MLYQTAHFAQFATENNCQHIPLLISTRQVKEIYQQNYFQTWKFDRIKPTDTFLVTIENGNGNVLERFKYDLPGTTFQDLKIWCVDNVIMFPEDY